MYEDLEIAHEVERLRLRVCCYDVARIKKNLCREKGIRRSDSGKEISSQTCCERKIIKTKLTAVKLLTQQGLKKIGSIAQIFYEHAAHINTSTGTINTSEAFTKKTVKRQGPEKTPLALGHTPLLSGEAG